MKFEDGQILREIITGGAAIAVWSLPPHFWVVDGEMILPKSKLTEKFSEALKDGVPIRDAQYFDWFDPVDPLVAAIHLAKGGK